MQAKCRCSLEKKSSRKIRFGNDLQFGAVDADELFDNYSCLKKNNEWVHLTNCVVELICTKDYSLVSNRRLYPLINFQEIFHPTRCY